MIALIVFIMLLGGTLGGFTNFLSTKSDKDGCFYLWRCLVSGIAAAFVVPLFLKMIQSNLLDQLSDAPIPYFIFLGFCVLAAFTSRTFLDSLAQKALRTADEAKQKATQVDAKVEENASVIAPLLAKETENPTQIDMEASHSPANATANKVASESAIPEISREDLDPANATLQGNIGLSQKPFSVLRALVDARYTFRTIDGVTANVKLPLSEVREILDQLKGMGFAGRNVRQNGERWYATAKGRRLISASSLSNLYSEPDPPKTGH